MELKDRLKQARAAKKLSQAKLAELAGVTQPTIMFIENGRNKGSSKIVDIANALDVSPDWLLHGKEMSNAEISKTPVAEWDESAPLTDEIVAIPYLNGFSLSAGTGAVNSDLPYCGAKLWFSKSFLKRRSTDISKIFSIDVKGDSMSPKFESGGIVIIDSANNTLEDGKVFAIHYDGQDFIKTLRWMPCDMVLIESENPIYRSFEVPLSEVTIIGRVIAYQREEF
ncbi:XRE family transcriptional regulator [Wohlfahrtiimonas chitiniclastica]|uniref:XRE family transcriptional regulator n=1 Tax=Wohlfahrtiimonas chitiniclastica TaxID=400946 RepID=UPI001BD0F608|nr:S24 family peptidase [Wohlfahrtiimonas chitiniclastica]MBS7837357.1 helix-turn-helix transcriptional regulator [Wohlfahrtiimonas chitiniclastica]